MDACEHRTPAVRSGAATTNLMRSSGVPCESALLRSKALGEVGVERMGPRAQQPRVAGCGVNLKRGERRDLQGLAAVDLDAQRGARRLLCETDGVGSVWPSMSTRSRAVPNPGTRATTTSLKDV